MPPSDQLVSFILGPNVSRRIVAETQRRAEVTGVDVLATLCHHTDLSEVQVYQRAAEFCGLPFSASIPQNQSRKSQITRLDHLGSVRSIRELIIDREVVFLSPTSQEMLALGKTTKTGDGTFYRTCVVPPRAIANRLAEVSTSALLAQSRQRLATRWPFASAHLDLGIVVRVIFVAALMLLLGITVVAPFWLEPALIPFLAIFFLLPASLRIMALFTRKKGRRPRPASLSDADLPVYTIMLPLRDEAHMVPQLAAAMRALDYPREKLDIKFIVEQTSTRTVHAVRRELGDCHFQLLVVPKAKPNTKPKALNYALPMVRGKYVVIYDAEDIPEPQQLRRAAARFASDIQVDCIQAELAINNTGQNWLTALFGAEYSGLFGVMLPALARWRLPMPLGGTSNHFRVDALLEVGGWDAFNVTEDADLGVRLARLRYRVGMLASRTFEEAPATYDSWISQRSRWMKGWMQTFIVHNRHASHFLADAGWRNFIAFQIHVGGMIFSAPLHLIFLLSLAARFALTGAFGLSPINVWTTTHLIVLAVGILAAASHVAVGMKRQGRRRHYGYLLLLPVYWALTSVAAFRAMYELIFNPYFWAKTSHSKTKKNPPLQRARPVKTHLKVVERVKETEPSS